MSSPASNTRSKAHLQPCSQCRKPTPFIVNNCHSKYRHCSFTRRYCHNCWSPQVTNYETSALGDSYRFYIDIPKEGMTEIDQKVYDQHVEPLVGFQPISV